MNVFQELHLRGIACTVQRDQLKAEVEALRKDSERLNFIEENTQKTLRIYKRKWSFAGLTNYDYPVFKSLRECIDHAMSEENK